MSNDVVVRKSEGVRNKDRVYAQRRTYTLTCTML